MKRSMIIALLLLSSAAAFAQKNNFYADVAFTPGGSVTYDRRLTRHLSAGGGIDVYNWRDERLNLRAAVYADLRPYWQMGRSLLFVIVDIGVAHFTESNPPLYTTLTFSEFNLHTGLGVGYGFRVARHVTPYVSAVLRGYKIDEHDTAPLGKDYGVFDATLVLSLGVKF